MILFYLVDNEILQSSRIIEIFGYKKVLNELENEIRLILAFTPLDEFIIFSPSFLCESRVAYDLSKRCTDFISEGFIKIYMREDSLFELREKKIDDKSYGRLFSLYPDIKKSYSKSNIKKVSNLHIPIERKIIKVGKGSFNEFVPRVISNSREEGVDITELIKRLSHSEKESFLWPSVYEQANKLFIPDRVIRNLRIRTLMNSSYLNTFKSQGIIIPINSNIIPNPFFETEDCKNNTIDLKKLKDLAKSLGIFNSIVTIPSIDLVKLKRNMDYSIIVSKIIEIVNSSKNITDALEKIRNNHYDVNINHIVTNCIFGNLEEKSIMKKKVFIVHGHDNEAKESMARVLEKGGFEPIILHEKASGGKTIIEKIEKYSDVSFAVVLYTPCDFGYLNSEDPQKGRNRARQNVVFEHGYLIAKLGRDKVCALVKGDIETPGDMSGVVYIEMDDKKAWKLSLARELKNAGLNIKENFYS